VLVFEKVVASRLSDVMTVFPQILMNVTVSAKPAISNINGLSEATTAIEKHLGDTGRVLIRYSGTQPMCRVMVEASTQAEATRFCKQLTDIIRTQIGK